jgi:hypothetical protein
MQQLNLDGYTDEIKEFVRRLSTQSDGAALQLEGRTVVFVLPAPSDNGKDEEWTDAKNDRRYVLIDKKINGTLTIEEAVELEHLQQALLRERQRIAPLPLEATRALHEDLLRKAQAAQKKA